MHMMSIVQNVCNWKTMRIGELKNDKKRQQPHHHHHQQQQKKIKKTKKSEPNWSWLALYNVLSPLFACKTDKEIHIAHWKKENAEKKQTNEPQSVKNLRISQRDRHATERLSERKNERARITTTKDQIEI